MSVLARRHNPLNTLIIKIASRCNIDCTYCYEYNRGDSSWQFQPKRLSLRTARQIGHRITEYCTEFSQNTFTLVFHGGEPLLVGPAYLENLILELRNSISCDIGLKFGLQTNGILVSDEFLNVFKRHRVSVGVSLDGDAFANRHRVDKKGLQTTDKVIASISRLNNAGCLSGIQAVIDLWSTPESVLTFLAEFKPQLIELAQPLGSHDNPPYRNAPPMTLGEWLIRAYDFWESSENMRGVKIAVFAEAMRTMLHGRGASDWFPGLPPNYLLTACDGSYEGLDALKIVGTEGRQLNLNVNESSIHDALSHPFISFRGSDNALPQACRPCAIRDWCCGGSYPSRYGNATSFDNPSIYCADMKLMFAHLGRAIVRSNVDVTVAQTISRKIQSLDEQNSELAG
jgi:uncharacterized protein